MDIQISVKKEVSEERAKRITNFVGNKLNRSAFKDDIENIELR